MRPVVPPSKTLLDTIALRRLFAASNSAHSDALVVLKDGHVAGAWYSGGQRQKIEAMSVTKSVVSLAVGRLLATKKIASIDQPVSTWFPEWKDGPKSEITLRHLLSHTSGIKDNRTTQEIYGSRDFVRLALDAELADPPGTRFFYNNKAVNLIAGIVERASGQKLDDFLRGDLFIALDITDFDWTRDSAGNSHGMSGLQIYAEDLAKLGQLLLHKGHWEGRQLIDVDYMEASTRPGSPLSPTCGLLWWLIPETERFTIDDTVLAEMRSRGAAADVIEKFASIKGTMTRPELLAALQRALGPSRDEILSQLASIGAEPARPAAGPIAGYRADGYLGQYMVVIPSTGVVAVRMVRAGVGYDERTDGLPQFSNLVRALMQ